MPSKYESLQEKLGAHMLDYTVRRREIVSVANSLRNSLAVDYGIPDSNLTNHHFGDGLLESTACPIWQALNRNGRGAWVFDLAVKVDVPNGSGAHSVLVFAVQFERRDSQLSFQILNTSDSKPIEISDVENVAPLAAEIFRQLEIDITSLGDVPSRREIGFHTGSSKTTV